MTMWYKKIKYKKSFLVNDSGKLVKINQAKRYGFRHVLPGHHGK